jgi:hypothetical protein
MPIKVKCREQIYYFRYSGIVTLEDIKETVLDQTQNFTYLAIHDFRDATLEELDHCKLSELGKYIEKKHDSIDNPKERCAIIVNNELDYGIMRCLTIYCCELLPIDIGIFYNVSDAFEFLVN